MASSSNLSSKSKSTSKSSTSSKLYQFQKYNPSLVEQSEIFGRLKVMSNILAPDICMSVRLSYDGKHFAVALANGNIHVYNSKNDNLLYKLSDQEQSGGHHDGRHTATAIRFRPWGRDGLTPNNFLIATYTNGSVKTFHFPTLSCVHELNESRAVLTCDYSRTGDTFSTSGDDGILNIYDDETRHLLVAYNPPFNEQARFQRVYSIQYHPHNTNELITGGWDDTIRYYDLRIPYLLNKFNGPHICGEGISFSPSGREFCTASWRKGDSLQIWDYATSKLIKTVDTSTNGPSGKQALPKHKINIPSQMNYSCKYLDENRVVVGGTQDDAVSLVHTLTGEVHAAIKGLTKSVYAVDSHGTKVAFVTGKEVALIDIYLNHKPCKSGKGSSIY